MKYKIGDEVVLKKKEGIKEEFKGKVAEITAFGGMAGWSGADYTMSVEGRSRAAYGSDKDIDHEKTAELNGLGDAIEPAHYRQGNIDRIEVWYQTYPFDGFRWAMKSHIDKYIHRYESKGGIEDLDKATYFIKRLKEKELDL